jgi:bacterioferritin
MGPAIGAYWADLGRTRGILAVARQLQLPGSMDRDLNLDLEAIRARAREKMADGAVTSTYGLDPEKVIAVLNDVLATELVCSLRYRNNYHVATGIHGETIAAEFLEHAAQEEQHAHQVAERITQLGGVPDMNPETLAARSHAAYVTSSNLHDLLEENLVAERIAIDTYAEIIRWLGDRDTTTRRLLEDVLEQEEEHADDLASLLRVSVGSREHH